MHSVPSFIVAALLVHSLSSASAAAAACPEPSSRAAIALPVAEAMQGFGAMDGERFAAAQDRAAALLPCLSEPLAPTEAAAFHGMMALGAFLQQDDAGAVNSFRAAIAADLTYTLPRDLVPDGHPILVQIQVASSLTGSIPISLPDLSPDSITVDGGPATSAPTDRPAVLQRLSSDGAVRDTVYLPAGVALPSWAPPTPLVADPLPADHRPPVLLALGAGASLAASGVCYGLARRAHDSFVSPETATGYPDDPAALRTQANSLTWASIGTAALALGLGTVTVVRW